MKVETHKSKTTFNLTVDAREYWLILRALGTFSRNDIKAVLEMCNDETQIDMFKSIKQNLYDTILSNVSGDRPCDSYDIYVKFKKDGEFE